LSAEYGHVGRGTRSRRASNDEQSRSLARSSLDNLVTIGIVDLRFSDLLERIYTELESIMSDFKTLNRDSVGSSHHLRQRSSTTSTEVGGAVAVLRDRWGDSPAMA
jgi:hypothetical protein